MRSGALSATSSALAGSAGGPSWHWLDLLSPREPGRLPMAHPRPARLPAQQFPAGRSVRLQECDLACNHMLRQAPHPSPRLLAARR